MRPDDRTRLAGLTAAMPGVARACPAAADSQEVPAASVALHEFLDAAVDGCMRAATPETAPLPAAGPDWVKRLGAALAGPEDAFELQGLADRSLPESLAQWTASATALAAGGRPTIGFRLEEPHEERSEWRISYHLVSFGGEGRVSVADLRRGSREALRVAQAMTRPEDSLLEGLGRAGRVFPPIERSLARPEPVGVMVDATEAWKFLTRSSLQLERAGYFVEVPKALSKVGRRRVRARMRVGVADPDSGRVGRSGLLDAIVHFSWEASLGDDTLTAREFIELASSNAPLVLHRGQWVAVDPEEVERIRALIEAGGSTVSAAEALRLALLGQVPLPGAPGVHADVVTEGTVARALEKLRSGMEELSGLTPPDELAGRLRPYQQRGFGWLESVTSVGFGACLADDMGLGKTVQLLALLSHLSRGKRKRKPRFLVVCPTSVIGNWCREIRRFVPSLCSIIHHGPSRAQSRQQLKQRIDKRVDAAEANGAVVVTSYALVRGDQSWLCQFPFELVALDEAQNIKNPDAGQSKAARRLKARRRTALTGTPVENRLTELWSIMDFLNPGLLGSRDSFKKRFAIPVERYADGDAAELLKRVTAPFIMRRLKIDPNIVPELPDKHEDVRYCPLTREQATLYQGAIDRGMSDIASLGQGMARRGRVLAMLTELKQVCNHPVQLLHDGNVAVRRSGKLVRFVELVEEVFENDGNALVFTQYREMGKVLAKVLTRVSGAEIPFLHGGLSRMARERLVEHFQDRNGPPSMVVSLRAGGTGLNLTRANHVFHYDRWWNPAVEDQATDRAFRIGQHREVTVHRLVCQGTLEEQIDQMLEEKRHLADKIIGTDETWLSELDDGALEELITLGQDAVLEEEQ